MTRLRTFDERAYQAAVSSLGSGVGCEDMELASAKTVGEAYHDLCARAVQEHGRDSYNGTISTTNGWKMLAPRPGELLAAFVDRILDDDRGPVQKWGLAGCVDLGPDPEKPGNTVYFFFGWGAS